jgi:hypothetical protein
VIENPPDGTFPYAINPAGTITGNYFNTTPPSLGQYSGFVQTAGGIFTSFDPPDSTNTTAPTAINPAGDNIGNYPDATFVTHGFLRIAGHRMMTGVWRTIECQR